MAALEMFGGDGGRHTLDYHSLVGSMDIWEVDRSYEATLRKNFPAARIKITDSFRELHSTCRSYDLIVIDAPGGLFGPGLEYCEHLQAFTPSIFRIARRSTVIIVSVFPEVADAAQSPELSQRLAARAAFYETDHPERLAVDEMLEAYRRNAETAGFHLQWHFSLRRTWRSKAYYLAMRFTQNTLGARSVLAPKHAPSPGIPS